MANTPKIRFKGFADAWKWRKLSDLCVSLEYGLNAAAKEFDGKNKYIRITDIDDTSREFSLADLSSPDICLEGMSKYLLSNGDIVFARTGASVGKTYIYKEKDGVVYFAGFLIRAKINGDNDAEFVFQNTLSENYEKYIRITSQRSGQPGVNAQEYGEYPLLVPRKEEQQKMGYFLRELDHLINLHQRKCDEAKELKKYMLQKMFPQNGKKIPEIRFAGFTDDWEQRKLGDVSESFSGGTPTVGVKKYYGGQIPFIRSAEINSDFTELFITEDGLKNSSARLVFIGDILYALYGATSGEVGRARMKGAINQAILAIKPYDGYDSEYIAQWLRKSKKSITETYLQGGQGNLSGAIVKELLIQFPSLKEQQQIGSYFHNLDHLITLNQRKCNQLKEVKKYMLQNMFPQKG